MSGDWHEVFDARRRAKVRLFTVAEARALAPQLLPILRELRDVRQIVVERRAELAKLTPAMRRNGHAARASELEQTLVAAVQRLTGLLETLTANGVLLKDMEQGLIDFPALRDGRVVLLCWRMDEPTVAFWHEVDTGFSDRRPL